MVLAVICLDPGHGGKDPGAVNGSRHEADDALHLALAAGNILSAQGHKIIYTRQTDIFIELNERARLARPADLTLSLHRNSFGSPAACGIEILCRYSGSIPAAETVLNEVYTIPHQSERGVKAMNLAVLSGLTQPGALLELGFISNAEDNRLFDQYFADYASAIARGVVKALRLSEPNISEEENDMVRYATVKDLPAWGQKTVQKLLDAGAIALEPDSNKIDLSEDMLRLLVFHDRLGVYGK
jgi:N-acetylmuramoyl-L-alanine amidase